MRALLAVALLLSAAPARAGAPSDAVLPQATPFEISRTRLLAEIAQWRSDYLYNPRSDPKLTLLAHELKLIEGAASLAGDEAGLAVARKRLEAWKRAVLRRPFLELKGQGGLKGVGFDQFVHDRSYTVDYYAAMRSELELAQHALSRLRELYLRQPAQVAENGVPIPKSRPQICPATGLLPHPKVPAKFDKLRAKLAKEGADPVVVDNVIHHALEEKADPILALSLVKKESSFNPATESKKGARGLTQVIPATGDDMGVHDSCKLFDVTVNLQTGFRYFNGIWKRFVGPEMTALDKLPARLHEKADMAIGAFNAGPNRVARLHRVPDIPETQDYIKKIRRYYDEMKGLVNN